MSRKIIVIMLGIVLSLWSCEQGSKQQSATPGASIAPQITVSEANARLAANPELVIIDVRTPKEYDGPLGHVAGSRLRPLQQIEKWAPEFSDRKEQEILLICRSGRRSGIAAKHLKEAGFQKVVNVEGGMIAWNQAELPVEKAETQPQ